MVCDFIVYFDRYLTSKFEAQMVSDMITKHLISEDIQKWFVIKNKIGYGTFIKNMMIEVRTWNLPTAPLMEGDLNPNELSD